MKCGFCIHAAVDARATPSSISPAQWGKIFKKANSLLHPNCYWRRAFFKKRFCRDNRQHYH